MLTTPPEPWFAFLRDLDQAAAEPTALPCFGGFVVTQFYGLSRTTVDLDVLDVAPIAARNRLVAAAGKGSPLALKHKVYLDVVGVAEVPYEYESRLKPIYDGFFQNLRLAVMDPYDLALSKLKRDSDRDFQDVMFLAQSTPFDLDLFERRYRQELWPYLLGDKKQPDYSFDIWLQSIRQLREV